MNYLSASPNFPRKTQNMLGLTTVRRSLVFAKLPQPTERLGIVLNARVVQYRGRHRLDDLAESHVLPQDPETGNRKPRGAKPALWAY